jgi:HEAT repeat protein
LTAGTASSDTFTTGTGSKTGLYIVPILAEMLDKTFESEDSYVRMNAASAANATGVVFYVMYGARNSTGRDGLPSVA